MNSTREILNPIEDLDPTDVPAKIETRLAKQLRYHKVLGSDVQPRLNALRSTNGTSIPTNEPDGADSMALEYQSSPNRETRDTSGFLTPSTVGSCTSLGQPIVVGSIKSKNRSLAKWKTAAEPPHTSEVWSSKSWQSEDGSEFSFDDSPLPIDASSTFYDNAGLDRQMPLFAKYGPAAYRQSPIPLLSSPAVSIDKFDDFSVLTPQSKEDYRHASAHLLQEGSSQTKVTSPKTTSSEQNYHSEPSFSDPVESSLNQNKRELPSLRKEREELDRGNPFWGQPPMYFPAVDAANDSPSSHNRFTTPVNRSHKLLLALEAVKQNHNKAALSPAPGHEITPVIDALTEQTPVLCASTATQEHEISPIVDPPNTPSPVSCASTSAVKQDHKKTSLSLAPEHEIALEAAKQGHSGSAPSPTSKHQITLDVDVPIHASPVLCVSLNAVEQDHNEASLSPASEYGISLVSPILYGSMKVVKQDHSTTALFPTPGHKTMPISPLAYTSSKAAKQDRYYASFSPISGHDSAPISPVQQSPVSCSSTKAATKETPTKDRALNKKPALWRTLKKRALQVHRRKEEPRSLDDKSETSYRHRNARTLEKITNFTTPRKSLKSFFSFGSRSA
jgi:hypothetical protein